MKPPKRFTVVPAVVEDAWEARWEVREVRPTGHGFPLVLGVPAGFTGRGGAKVVLTEELVAHLEAHRLRPAGLALPLGGTAIKRLRKALGHHRYADRRAWWEERADDLADSTYEAFAARHAVPFAVVSWWARAMFGKRLREPGWWRKEPARSLLAGHAPRPEVAERLDVSIGTVGRLRWRLRKEQNEEETRR